MKLSKIKSLDAFYKILELSDSNFSVLDIGSGEKEIHSNMFREKGYQVDTVDFFENSTYKGDFNNISIEKNYNIVWASHCLEHQLNVNLFLNKIYNTLTNNGYLVITVPPFKHQIVGGHLSLWNGGLLIYNLILAGFDCSDVKIKKYGYNISAIVQKKNTQIPFRKLVYDTEDLNTLREFFPNNINYKKNNIFDGDIEKLNWD